MKNRIISIICSLLFLVTVSGCNNSLPVKGTEYLKEQGEKLYTENAEKLREEFKDALQELASEYVALEDNYTQDTSSDDATETIPIEGIPQYTGESITIINQNMPSFTEEELLLQEPFEKYSELDYLGRAGTAFGLVGKETMPTEERGSIGKVKPTGWHTVKYPEVIEDNYLYNRCHLIAFCLSAENANEQNLITGTRHMNVSGMLPYETKVADYIDKTGNHVLYRATPIYEGDNMVAHGVQMEAYSIEDQGEGVQFNIFVHNIQPGVVIDYATGESHLDDNYR